MMDSVAFVIDPLHMSKGAVAPPIELAKYFMTEDINSILIAPFADKEIAEELENIGLKIYSLKRRAITLSKVPTFDTWLEAVLRVALGCRGQDLQIEGKYIVINTSSSLVVPSHFYYGQGPMTCALRDMLKGSLKAGLRVTIKTLLPLLRYLEKRFLVCLRKHSKIFLTNSYFTKKMYENMDITVNGVIYPPLNTEKFRPTTGRPSKEYVLTYIGVGGKEGIPEVIRKIADKGVKIKAFGIKALYVPKDIFEHPNIEFLGYVSDEELINLYSNALYTLFTFTHEPFGYIPVESMACGTPVLTYNKQGPSETVIDGTTGWLADSDEELINLGVMLWRKGYPSWIRSKCRERALEFDIKVIARRWIELMNTFEL